MRKLISIILSMLLLINLIGCSKASSETTPTSRVYNTDDAEAIEIITTNDIDEVVETAPPFEVHIPTYKVKDCELDVDSVNQTIRGQYVDGSYVVDFDLTYYDYGVKEVSIYKGVPTKKIGMQPVDTLDTEWGENKDDVLGAIKTFSNDEHRKELSVQCALTYNNGLVDSSEDLIDITSIITEYGSYKIFPHYSSYQYPVAEMNASVESDEYIYKMHKDTEQVNFVTIRTELEGLPIGVPFDNYNMEFELRFGDYYGSFFGIDDNYTRGFYKKETCTQIDFIYYNYNAELVDSSTATVMPLEECIMNSLPGIINNYGAGDCHVYAAELVYAPFSVGCNDIICWDFDAYYIPVWAVYMISSETPYNQTRANAIYLNAITGELVSYGK